MTTAATLADDPIFHEAPVEPIDAELRVIEGTLPNDLRGTFIRNGPGAFKYGDDSVHFLDGHGYVAAVRFEPGKPARLRARFVDTPVRRAELAQHRLVQRRPFTNLPKRWSNFLDIKLGNTAAHDAYIWGGDLVASDAPGHFLVDLNTLETKGRAPIDQFKRAGNSNLSPMPRHDASQGRLVAYEHKPGLFGNDSLAFYELDPRWNVVKRVERPLPAKGAFLHDHAFSERWYITWEFGRLDAGKALGGKVPIIEAITFAPTDSLRVFAMPREGDGPVRVATLPAGHEAFHIFNAFDRDEDTLVFDGLMYRHRVDFRAVYPASMRDHVIPPGPASEPFVTRFVFDLKRGTLSTETIEGIHGDAPDVNPAYHGKKHRYGYCAAMTSRGREPEPKGFFWYHGIGRVDFDEKRGETWDAGPDVICSPPSFAPRVGSTSEDDGYVLTYLLDDKAQRTDVAIFDARQIANGPIARLAGPTMLPGVSHTAFWSS